MFEVVKTGIEMNSRTQGLHRYSMRIEWEFMGMGFLRNSLFMIIILCILYVNLCAKKLENLLSKIFLCVFY